MKKRLLALALVLALLSGCAPAGREPPPAPPAPAASAPARTPSPSPTPAPVDLDAFLAQVNGRRRAELAAPLPDLAPYTPDYEDQMGTFDAAAMDRLLTPHGLERPLTRETAREDVETFFTLLRTTYGAYGYFGGDEVFLPLKEQALEAVAREKIVLTRTIENALYGALAPVLRDGHFSIGGRRLLEERELRLYHVPDLYLPGPEGLEGDYVKPTIGPDGAIVYGFFALSRDGADLPPTLGGHTLEWRRAGEYTREQYQALHLDSVVFARTEHGGLPVLESRLMMEREGIPDSAAQLEELASCGGEYRDVDLFCFDVRYNTGGYSTYGMEWFRGFTGVYPNVPRAHARKYGDLARETARRYGSAAPLPAPGAWARVENPGTWHARDGVVLVLMGATASAGEEMVEYLRTVENVLLIGANTGGCFLVPSNNDYYLPHSGVRVFFGQGLGLGAGGENTDGVGFLPDLWVDPAAALDAATRLCAHYGLSKE